jgi:hypothetical protein
VGREIAEINWEAFDEVHSEMSSMQSGSFPSSHSRAEATVGGNTRATDAIAACPKQIRVARCRKYRWHCTSRMSNWINLFDLQSLVKPLNDLSDVFDHDVNTERTMIPFVENMRRAFKHARVESRWEYRIPIGGSYQVACMNNVYQC